MPHVYILKCADGSFYTGSTIDLARRVAEHMDGLGATYTRERLPVTLVWSAEYDRVDDAFFIEKRLQGWSRAKKQAVIDGRFDDLPRLSCSRITAWRDPEPGTDPVAGP
ncbi:GIY-YIG nuclease family protein [Plantibacter sp. VKM Ac-2885]|uniref:GIY-YIG nuclease family protein n=1 Tax=unclassified Plantibacter TaxID=2624265 RepID=UPI000F5E7F02|nr:MULTISPECIES: GIY-YIG nuclease family protein [unclassified Plantibacter]AZH84475.1 GIY-YIG nuclease family protein [Plantibacter sp. PA-3-X8]MBD8103683.1 GIY-YIG nuclease family protein [Plantibacter sp. CFBP 8775]MBD8467132.1 GIY-YIG nuclease family protein [Plantibacter sp. CFBP 8798]MBF4514265.1 GIY-YIG nuclease family protein [Plantibacter sp. VKM Ac-2885]